MKEYVLRMGLCGLMLFATPTLAGDVVVNGISLDQATQQGLEHRFGVSIKPGRYWYDAVSGVWGKEGGPGAGQILPGLDIGGPLKRDASNGKTGVIVNGRELHELDVTALERCLFDVVPGRYWVLPNGLGGPEGGHPQFNLAVLCGAQSAGGSRTQCEDYGDGQYNCSNQRTGIGIIGEGNGQGAVFIDGKVIMTPN